MVFFVFLCSLISCSIVRASTKLITHQGHDCFEVRRGLDQALHARANRRADSALPIFVLNNDHAGLFQFAGDLVAIAADDNDNR